MTLKERQQRMQELVQQWDASGQSIAQFVTENKINKSTFYYWVGKHRKKNQQQAPDSFIQLCPESTAAEMVVRYPNGVEIFLPINTSAQMLIQLIRL